MAKPITISLFSGAGGMDYGLEAAGFETRFVTDLDRMCCQTLRSNREWPVVEGDIHAIASQTILDTANLKPGEADLLTGGPPCQPFSKSGYWSKGDSSRLSDPRSSTLGEYLRVVEDTLPKAILLENVEGLSYSNKSEGLQFVLDGLDEINRKHDTLYRAHLKILNAADYGIPQVRQRLIMVASREGKAFRFPEPRFGEGLKPHRTAWDALWDVPSEKDEDLRVRGKWGDLLASIPEGQNYLWHTDRGGGRPLFGWRRRYWSFLLKLAKDRPSWTIQAQPGPAIGPFHWKNRLLSHRELCRLQTFPDDVTMLGGRGDVQRQIGNAVPSLLSEVLGREILTQFLGREVKGELRLMPPDKRPFPPAERTLAVPSKFLELLGSHAAHPGTGKGYGAIQRSEPTEIIGRAEAQNGVFELSRA